MRIGRYRAILELIWPKNRGNVGRHPHMIPAAISPDLVSYHEISCDQRKKRAYSRTYDHKL